ncbi:hypothetical protein Tco_0180499 [Tanacetum coccineum]
MERRSIRRIQKKSIRRIEDIVCEYSGIYQTMDDPDITMEEYIRLEEEKAQKHREVFNWETAKYGKIWYDEYIHDLRSVESEFPAIAFNDEVSSEKTLSLSEYDEEERNILYFNDLFPFNIIRLDDLKSEKDNDDNNIDIIQSSEDMAPLPPCEQRYLFLRMVMEHRDDAGVVVFTSRAWGRLFNTRGPLVWELILEFLSTLRFGEFILALGLHFGDEMESPGFARYWSESERMIPRKGDLHDYWRGISTDEDLLGPPPSYTLIRDLMLRLFYRMMVHSIAGRSQAPEKIYEQLDDTWVWVAIGPKRQPDVAADAPGVAQEAHVVDKDGQANLTPVQAPSPLPAAARTMP